ncbi:uncharacterized protein LOC134216168 [Armigeres subalbatus]|uniref:uncharacterized protein LOC134216168 n=1 Tax=Armigeres subalbatus TaxID=124917 RepID=UPI002ED61373
MDRSIHTKQKHTRRRLNPTIRWNEVQTQELLVHVLEEVGIHPGSFEKPTAQIFYAKICSKASVAIRYISWQIIKNKMRNLKTSFLATALWKAQEGAKLLANGGDCLYHDHIRRVCPHFDLLERLYGHLVQANMATGMIPVSSDVDEYADEMITNDVLSSELYSAANGGNNQANIPFENVRIKLETNEHPSQREPDQVKHAGHIAQNAEAVEDYIAERAQLAYTPEPSTASNSETDFYAKRALMDRFPRKRPASDTSSVFQLVVMQEKKLKFEVMKLQQQLDLERQKLDLERQKLCLSREQNNVDLEMKRLQLERETELKKLELERDERIALAKMKLEVESLERIRKYELDLQANRS